VKSVLGEFSSVVSICRNKGTRLNLGAPFLPAPPRTGGLSSGSGFITIVFARSSWTSFLGRADVARQANIFRNRGPQGWNG